MTSTHHALCELALVNINDDEHLSTADDQEEFDAVQVRAGQIENKITDLRRKYEEHKDHISSMEASGKNIKFAQVQRIKKTAERSLTIKFDTRGLLKDIKNLQMNIKVCKANQEKDGANKRLLESQNRAREATEGRERAEKRLKVSQDSIREANQQKLRAIQQLRELENAARKLKRNVAELMPGRERTSSDDVFVNAHWRKIPAPRPKKEQSVGRSSGLNVKIKNENTTYSQYNKFNY